MPKRISELLRVPQNELIEKGVYDCLLDFDNPLHIDPALISLSGINEFKHAKALIVDYFTNILRLIRGSKSEGDLLWSKALSKISTGEGIKTALGYARGGTAGSGIGKIIGGRILSTIKLIQEAGVNDPEIFELVGIFESNVGPDRISDLISFIVKDELCLFTQRVSSELKIKNTKSFNIFGQVYNLPINPIDKDYVIFVPISILNDLPIAEKWDDIPIAADYNSSVRQSLNSILGDSWRNAAKAKKEDFKEIIINSPEIVKELLKLYKARLKHSYDFKVDHLGDLLWDDIGYSITKDEKLDLQHYKKALGENVFNITLAICDQFKNLIENNNLAEHLYDLNGKKRPERFPQLLLFAIADSYCLANGLDISREANEGPGALDFKFSFGVAKSTLELKYSSNNKLIEGYEKQLKAYNDAEKVPYQNSVYLIIRVNNKNDHKIKEIEKLISESKRLKNPCPSLIIIDGILKPSASLR